MKKWILDITPVVETINGDRLELGTVRYTLNETQTAGAKYSGYNWSPTIPMSGSGFSPRISFKVELKDEQLEPTPIPRIETEEKQD